MKATNAELRMTGREVVWATAQDPCATVEALGYRTMPAGLADELLAWCRERMAAFKCPKTVDVRAELPRNPTG